VALYLNELTGKDDNEWLCCFWKDEDGLSYCADFIEEDQIITLQDSTIFMKDSEDEDTTILLLGPMVID